MKKYNKEKSYFIVVLLTASKPAFASDPTGLFVLFIGMPAVVIGISLIPLSYFKPKIGLFFSVSISLLHVPLFSYFSDIGYLDSAGGWLYISAILTGVSLLLAVMKVSESWDDNFIPNYDWVCKSCDKTNMANEQKCKYCNEKA